MAAAGPAGPGPVGDGLAAALAENRDRCNAVVVAGRRSHADFDVALLEEQIRGPLQAIVAACEAVAPGSGSRVLAAVFEPVVELVGQRRLGGGSHDVLLATLPRMAAVLADDPRLVVGSLANAIVRLSRFGRPADVWLDRVAACSARTTDAAAVLRAGAVAAWAVGMAQHRNRALATAEQLSGDLLSAALDAPGPLPVAETVDHLRRDRWWRPGRDNAAAPRAAYRVGGFRGFGGPFLAPPRVGVHGGRIVVVSNGDAWTLHADVWGSVLTRTSAEGWENGAGGQHVPPHLFPTSATEVDNVVAVTVATSYDVLVFEPPT